MSDDVYGIRLVDAHHSEDLHIYETVEDTELLTFRFEFARMRDRSDRLSAEITVWMEFNGQDSPPKRVMGPVEQNLLSSTWARSLAKPLQDQTPEYDWHGILAELIPTTIEHHRGFVRMTSAKQWKPDPEASPFIINPFVAASGVTVLFGAGMTGKSTIAVAMAMGVRTGMDMFGYEIDPADAGPVLWVDYEAHEDEVYERDLALRLGMGKSADWHPEHELYYARMRGKFANSTSEIRRRVHESGAKMIVVDSVANARGGDAVGAEETIRLFKAMGSLEMPVLAIDHLTKQDVREKDTVTPYGSVFTINEARLMWSVQLNESASMLPATRMLNMKMEKQNRFAHKPPRGWLMEYESNEHDIISQLKITSKSGVDDLKASGTKESRIMYVLSNHPNEYITAARIASEGQLELQGTKNELTRMAKAGTITIGNEKAEHGAFMYGII